MAARTQQSFFRPVSAYLFDGSTTPNPGAINAVALSSATGGLMRWNGVIWTTLSTLGTPTRVSADSGYVVPANQQILAFVPIVVDGTMVVTGTLVMQ